MKPVNNSLRILCSFPVVLGRSQSLLALNEGYSVLSQPDL